MENEKIEEKILNDDELEMLFQTNTTNFITNQRKINKKTDEEIAKIVDIFNCQTKMFEELDNRVRAQKVQIHLLALADFLIILAYIIHVVF